MFSAINRLWKYIEGLNGFLLILYSIFVFATAVMTSEHFSSYYFLVSIFFITVLSIISIIICPFIIRFFSLLSINNKIEKKNKLHHSAILRIALYGIPFVILLIFYLAYYPGGFSVDSISQYTQAINNQYIDWHPVIQTLFAFKLPLTLTGGWIGSITLFQIICFSAVLGYAFTTVYKYTNLKYTIISMIFVLINPQFCSIAMYPWKDVSFSIGALLLLTYSLQIFLTKGTWIKTPTNTIMFVLTASMTTLFRHNALLFTIPLIFANLFYITKKRGLVICSSVVILCLGVKFPLYTAMGVDNPDERQIETLGLPMNVIGAVVTYTPEALDDETREFAYKVAPKEVWEERYYYGSYNTVKYDDRTHNEIIEEYGSQKVVSMMFRCFYSSKEVSLKSLIKLTEASFSVTSDYDKFIRPYIEENDFDIIQKYNWLTAVCDVYRSFVKVFLSYPFLHLGFLHMLLIGVILSKCKLNKLKDWKKIFFIIPVFAYNYVTTLLLTGIEDASRFFFYTFLLIPLLLVFMFKKENEDIIEI